MRPQQSKLCFLDFVTQSITSMSNFSMSLALMEKGYVHPGYQMDGMYTLNPIEYNGRVTLFVYGTSVV